MCATGRRQHGSDGVHVAARSDAAAPAGHPSGVGTSGTTASPPNIRWSTNRSSRPVGAHRRRARCRTRRCRSAAASGGLQHELAAHAEVGQQGLAGVEREPEELAAAHDVAHASRRPAGRRSRAGPASCRRTGRGWSTSTGADPGAGDPAGQAAPDDLDLGQFGHAARPSGRRRRPPRLRPVQPGAARSASNAAAAALLLGLLLAPPAARAARAARRRAPSAWNSLAWSGPSSVTAYSGTPRPSVRGELLQAGLPVQARAERGGGRQQRVDQAVHEGPGDLDAVLEVDGADQRLEGVGEDRGLVPPAAASPRRGRAGCARRRRGRGRRRASARMLTTAARSLASWPSGRSGCRRYSASVTTSPSTASPRNSRRSLVGRPPFSYAYERWVSARTSRPRLERHARGALERASAVASPAGVPSVHATRTSAAETCSEVLDLAALVLQVQRGAGRVGDDARLVRPRVGDLAALDRRGQRRRASPSTASGGTACCCGTSSASGRPRSALFLVVVHVGRSAVSPARRVTMPCSAAHRGSALSCVVLRVVREPRPALGAQTRAVVPAHRLERQCEHHRVPQRGLQVDQVVLQLAQLVLVLAPSGVRPG